MIGRETPGPPPYRLTTDAAAVEIGVERPILYLQLHLGNGRRLHAVIVHLKSKVPADIPGQKIDSFTWRTADSWPKNLHLIHEGPVSGTGTASAGR
jgi:hypothetical protein